jgi:hypothetical protein
VIGHAGFFFHRPKWDADLCLAAIRLSDGAKITFGFFSLWTLLSLLSLHTHTQHVQHSPQASGHAPEWYVFMSCKVFLYELASNSTAGKNWHSNKKAFRPTAGLKSYAKRLEDRVNLANIKERERELKEEKQAERDVCAGLFNAMDQH